MDISDQIHLLITKCTELRAVVKQFQPKGSRLSILSSVYLLPLSGWALTVLLQVSQGVTFPGNYRAIYASPLHLDPLEEFASYP